MIPVQKQPSTPLYLVMAVALSIVFIADLYTSLGIAVWIFYLLPIVLSFFLWRPIAPLIIAIFVIAMMILGFLLSPVGMSIEVARVNRLLGVITVGSIAVVGSKFIQNKIAIRIQEWLHAGQSKLNERMAGDPSISKLGEEILGHFAEYLESQSALLYVRDGNEFTHAASYALPSTQHFPESVKLGEGVLGQAAKDKQISVLKDLPPALFVVESGLVNCRPKAIIVAPAVVDDEVIAIIELSFLKTPTKFETQFVERTLNAIAIAIRSAQYRLRLKDLLAETQQQAEELQVQSEELRVSNEELEEQGNTLRESQTRLELQQTELEQTNTQLEEQAQILEGQRDYLVQAKRSLEQKSHELEMASRYKSDFLANMSHELRTPLNSSLIMAKLLADNRDGNLTAEQIKYAETIYDAGNDLLTLINDILDLSKIESGHMDISVRPRRITDLVEGLAKMFGPVASNRSLEFKTHITSGSPEWIETDTQRLEQILKNLLSNAIKFTEVGSIELKIGTTAGEQFYFAVIDTGIGIRDEQQEMIFEAFRQADGTTNRRYGGTGLGLSISRKLASLLGGKIDVTSEVGKGSTFTLQLPVRFDPPAVSRDSSKEPLMLEQKSARGDIETILRDTWQIDTDSTGRRLRDRKLDRTNGSPPPSQPSIKTNQSSPDSQSTAGTQNAQQTSLKANASHRRILVVEDDESFIQILNELADELSFECLVARTAEEGIRKAIDYIPSAIILDVGLPDHSGLSVLDRIKQDSRTRHIPVHIVSASDYSQTALSLGAIGYMLKPVKRDELQQALNSIEVRMTQRIRRVLLVEDDEVQLESLKLLIESRDVKAVGVRSASQCLEQLQQSTFDCMVLDLSLSDTTGFSLLETLSLEDRYSFPPVIVYTGRDLSADEEQLLRKYSKSIIIKGAKSPERLLDEVTLFLHQVVSELPAEQQRMLKQARSRDAALEGKSILIVEDDVRNVFALTSILEPKGALIKIARNGREAIEALEQSSLPNSDSIDLVLMDVMMPEMDGLTATKLIRKNPLWKKLPVIALTAKAMANDQQQCLDAGANDYMAKPLDIEKLLSLVRVWMPR